MKKKLTLLITLFALGGWSINAQVIVKDINPGVNGSMATTITSPYLTNVNGTLFFMADNGTNGQELWKSDGMATGTLMAKDIYPGVTGSSLTSLTNVNGILFFYADNGTNGRELWKSDGTAAGTVMVKDICVGSGGSMPYGYYIYSSLNLTNVNGTLYFVANDGTNGNELWKSDGTAAGTVMVKDIYPGYYYGSPNTSAPSFLTNVNGTLFFSADDGTNGRELWKSNGTAVGTVMVKDIKPGSDKYGPISSSPFFLTNVNGILCFLAWNVTNGWELWKSDGTTAGTVMVNNTAGSPSELTNVNGVLYFNAYDGTHGWELWKSDGTVAGTAMLKDIYQGLDKYGNLNSSAPFKLTNVNGTLYFAANSTNGWELWKSDGTAAGTVIVKDIYQGLDKYGAANNSHPSYLTNFNGTLYFAATDSTHGVELWKSNGTAAGTVMLNDINTGLNGSTPAYLTNVNGTLYFVANDGTHGEELWKYVCNTTATITASGATTFCKGGSVTLTSGTATSYLWSNGATTQSIVVKTTGKDSVTVTDTNGCSASSVATAVTVNTLPAIPTISKNNSILISSAITGNQWYLNGNIITGATSPYYTATQNGNYTVTVTDTNKCSATSLSFNYIGVGIEEVAINNRISISPNPTNGKFTINMENVRGQMGDGKLAVYNVLGERVYTATNLQITKLSNYQIDLSALPAGIYFLQVNTGEEIVNRKLVLEK